MQFTFFGDNGRRLQIICESVLQKTSLMKKSEMILSKILRPDGILINGDRVGSVALIAKTQDIGCFEHHECACVISCGLGTRDSVSISSILPNKVTISVRRELPCVNGGSVCQQDIPLQWLTETDVELVAIAAACLLYVGVKPETLSEFIF